MEMRHPNCRNDRCSVCLRDHGLLNDLLDKLTGDDTVDHLGRYRSWLERNGGNFETEWGWATPEVFEDDNINSYAKWYRKEHEPE